MKIINIIRRVISKKVISIIVQNMIIKIQTQRKISTTLKLPIPQYPPGKVLKTKTSATIKNPTKTSPNNILTKTTENITPDQIKRYSFFSFLINNKK
jgi:hypothetical protein